MKIKLLSAILIASFFAVTSCSQKKQAEEKAEPANWAERLGYPADKKVIMLHIDDAGMCEEANIATKKYLLWSQSGRLPDEAAPASHRRRRGPCSGSAAAPTFRRAPTARLHRSRREPNRVWPE